VALPLEDERPNTPDLHLLSPREAEVLANASQGLTNEQMAARLNVTVHAVKFHLASIYRKLGVANRTEAAAVYLRAPSFHTHAGPVD
jgi:DNA-binding NarL/FixJ family response regulator